MDCDTAKYTDTPSSCAGYLLFRKSKFATDFVDEWLYYTQDERIVTDMPNQMGKPNYPGFRLHKNDQSIFSLLVKKHGLEVYRNISEHGLNPKAVALYKNESYSQIVHGIGHRDYAFWSFNAKRFIGDMRCNVKRIASKIRRLLGRA